MPGTTQYPELVDNNVELTDGVDIMEADNVNDAYAALDAIETFLGASGATQNKNIDVLAFLEAVVSDMRLVWKDVNTITVKAGRIYCKKSDNSIRVLRKNIVDVDVTFADLDAGSRALNTAYYIYAIADASATTVTFKISASASAPTGAILFANVGGFVTDGVGAGEIIENTVRALESGNVLQTVVTLDQVARSISTPTFPADGSKPQISEGGAYPALDTVFLPKRSDSFLIFEISIQSIAESNFGSGIQAFLFHSLGADALAGASSSEFYGCGTSGSTAAGRRVSFVFKMPTGTLSPRTFSIRLGCTYGGGLINQDPYEASGWGGSISSSMKITEVRA